MRDVPGHMKWWGWGESNKLFDISNIILYQVVRKMLDDIKNLLLDQSTVIHYLQGIFSGEASVKPTKYGSLDDVNVGAVVLEDQKFYADCLLKLGISSSFEKSCIRIHNMENFQPEYFALSSSSLFQ